MDYYVVKTTLTKEEHQQVKMNALVQSIPVQQLYAKIVRAWLKKHGVTLGNKIN
jgi:hypothetical protein